MPMLSNKRIQIDKAKSTLIATIAITTFITIFSLFATRALLSQRAYQSRVIEQKELAVATLRQNIDATEELVRSYQLFVSSPDNILQGSSAGSGDRDGDNAKIILDALPSRYDFPALTASIEKLLTGYEILGITGTDEEVTQSANTGEADPRVVEIPFGISTQSSYENIQALLVSMQSSIRPIKINTMTLSGTNESLQLDVQAVTNFKPPRTLEITKQVVQ